MGCRCYQKWDNTHEYAKANPGARTSITPIYNLTLSQVDVSHTQIEFYSSDFIVTTLRPRRSKGSKLGAKNPNAVYIGKRVIAVGMNNHWKGYKGRIKDTNPSGDAWVELDARQQQVQQFKINQLAFLCVTLTSRKVEKIQYVYFRSNDKTSLRRAVPIDTPSLQFQLLPLQPPLEPPTTPLPTPSGSTETSPAWDPSSRTPLPMFTPLSPGCGTSHTSAYFPQDNNWLKDVALTHVRIQVTSLEDGPGGNVLEVISTEMGRVKVRDGMRTRVVPLDSLAAIHPASLGELVTPIRGTRKGTIFKVTQITDGQCLVRIPGERDRKKKPNPQYSISDLVQVYPSAR